MTFCLLWESALNKYCCIGSYICLLAIYNYKPPITLQEWAERGPVTLLPKWLYRCFYSPVMLTQLYSVFLFICFFLLKYDLHMLHFGKKCWSETKEWSFFGVYNMRAVLHFVGVGIFCVCVNRIQMSFLVAVCTFLALTYLNSPSHRAGQYSPKYIILWYNLKPQQYILRDIFW